MEKFKISFNQQQKNYKSQFEAIQSQMEQRSFVNDVVIFDMTIPRKPQGVKRSEYCLQSVFRELGGVNENDINYCEIISKNSIVVSFVRKMKKQQVLALWYKSNTANSSKIRHRFTDYYKKLIADAKNLTSLYSTHLQKPFFHVDKLKIKEKHSSKTHIISNIEELKNLKAYASETFVKKTNVNYSFSS